MSKILEETKQGDNKNLEPEATYTEGLLDGIRLMGSVCGRQGSCEDCPISVIKSTNMTCQQFAADYPQKMLSILMEMNNKDYTYFEEYCNRFPQCNLTVDIVSKISCRKAIFEGYCGCDGEEGGHDCKDCWLEQYRGDVTEFEEIGADEPENN